MSSPIINKLSHDSSPSNNSSQTTKPKDEESRKCCFIDVYSKFKK